MSFILVDYSMHVNIFPAFSFLKGDIYLKVIFLIAIHLKIMVGTRDIEFIILAIVCLYIVVLC